VIALIAFVWLLLMAALAIFLSAAYDFWPEPPKSARGSGEGGAVMAPDAMIPGGTDAPIPGTIDDPRWPLSAPWSRQVQRFMRGEIQ